MSIVNTTTGEVVGRDPQSVVDFLENAKWMLDAAVEMTGPAEVALIKAQVVMAETYARELSLSKDIQEQSKEMVRRAEYALARSIKQGQDEGIVRTRGERGPQISDYERVRNGQHELVQAPSGGSTGSLKPGPTDFASHHELYGNGTGVMNLAAISPDQFDAALDAAKADGDLSRANVVRKVKGQQNPAGLNRQQRADLIADLAEQGLSSRQMPARVGVTEETVRQIARDFDIEIPADRVVGRTRRIDHTDVVSKTVIGLEDVAEFVHAHIDLNEVDFTEADEWVSSLSKSISALTRFRNQIKEKTHV